MGEDRREKARNLLLTEIFDADSQIMRLQSQIRELLQKAVDLDIQRLGYVEKITMDCMGLYHYAIDARDKEHRLYPESMYKEGEELYRPPYMGQEPGHPGREQGAAPGQEPGPPRQGTGSRRTGQPERDKTTGKSRGRKEVLFLYVQRGRGNGAFCRKQHGGSGRTLAWEGVRGVRTRQKRHGRIFLCQGEKRGHRAAGRGIKVRDGDGKGYHPGILEPAAYVQGKLCKDNPVTERERGKIQHCPKNVVRDQGPGHGQV